MNSRCIYHVLIVSGIVGLAFCKPDVQQTPAQMLIGKWQLVEFTPAPQFPMPDSVRQRIIDLTIVEYTAEQTFRQTGIGRVHTGTYRISDDGKEIIFYHNERQTNFKEHVKRLTPTRLSVIDQNGNQMTRKKITE
jgi:hypothetical protein